SDMSYICLLSYYVGRNSATWNRPHCFPFLYHPLLPPRQTLSDIELVMAVQHLAHAIYPSHKYDKLLLPLYQSKLPLALAQLEIHHHLPLNLQSTNTTIIYLQNLQLSLMLDSFVVI